MSGVTLNKSAFMRHVLINGQRYFNMAWRANPETPDGMVTPASIRFDVVSENERQIDVDVSINSHVPDNAPKECYPTVLLNDVENVILMQTDQKQRIAPGGRFTFQFKYMMYKD